MNGQAAGKLYVSQGRTTGHAHIMGQYPTSLALDRQVDANGRGPSGPSQIRDAETFDDTEFYSTLLKELLESTDSTALASQTYAVRMRSRMGNRS